MKKGVKIRCSQADRVSRRYRWCLGACRAGSECAGCASVLKFLFSAAKQHLDMKWHPGRSAKAWGAGGVRGKGGGGALLQVFESSGNGTNFIFPETVAVLHVF